MTSPLQRARETIREGIALELICGHHETANYLQGELDRMNRNVARLCLRLGMEAGHAEANRRLAARNGGTHGEPG